MNKLLLLWMLPALLLGSAWAQTGTPAAAAPRAADYIVAVVNAEPITNQQVAAEVARLRRQLAAQRRPEPPAAELAWQVLNQLITERVQLQLARELGIRVDEPSIDQAEQTIASQNQLTLEQLHRELQREGIDRARFREQLRDQLLLTRLREREVEPRVRVSEADIDQYLAEQRLRAQDPAAQQVNMAHILIPVPDGASEQQVAELRARAQA
ncbi:MAG: SurA N-terminal domain-containing protein, partial [Hylemonella sp.]